MNEPKNRRNSSMGRQHCGITCTHGCGRHSWKESKKRSQDVAGRRMAVTKPEFVLLRVQDITIRNSPGWTLLAADSIPARPFIDVNSEITLACRASTSWIHRRIEFSDLVTYERIRDQNRREALDRLSAKVEEVGLYVSPYTGSE